MDENDQSAAAPNDRKSETRIRINPPVFFSSAGLIAAFAIFGAVAPETASGLFVGIQDWIVATFGWFYVLSVAIFVIFAIGLALSDYGRIKLGPDDARPDFTYMSWFAMLFSAGMGIGLMFFAVAEPVMHYSNPPVGEAGTVSAAREAMKITFFHWGLHAWAIYAVIGLALAYYAFRHNLPLTVRSALYPLIGERIYGPIGHAADTFAVLGTMFGVATSLGFGVLQVNAGLNYLFDIPNEIGIQMILILIITLMATVSVVAGLDAGIRRISEWNLVLAVILLVFIAAVGPTLFLLEVTTQNIGAYFSEVVSKTFTLYAYEPTQWIGGWTLFYWAWWIAWSPFVGMFIARVSRGRTIREFVVCVLFVPVGFTFVWLSFFGNTAIALDMGVAAGAITTAVNEDVSLALFRFLEYFPLAEVSSLLATVLVVTFFVTSSDSGSLVIDIITSGGSDNNPVWQRTFWALSEGVVAAVLLWAGGLKALQTAAISAALPFSFVMLFVCYGLMRSLRFEGIRQLSQELPESLPLWDDKVPWQQYLRRIVNYPRRAEVERFLQETVIPVMQEVAAELNKLGHEAGVDIAAGMVSLEVRHGEERDFLYAVRARGFNKPSFSYLGPMNQERSEQQRYYRAEVDLLEGSQNYDVMGYTHEQLISDILSQYRKHHHYLHLVQ